MHETITPGGMRSPGETGACFRLDFRQARVIICDTMPEPFLAHEDNPAAIPSAPSGAVPGILPLRRHRGLRPPPFLPPEIQADLHPLFDTLAVLRLVTHTPEFTEETREFLLDCVDMALDGAVPEEDGVPEAFTTSALRFHTLCQRGRFEPQWARRLVQAARRDVARPTCSTWSDLMLYCRYAAEPLGRAVLQRCGITGRPDIERATDALTAALLVMHLMRRAGEDWRDHGRCFLPADWIAEEGGSREQLVEQHLSPALLRVCQRMLERVGKLLEQAAPLPGLFAAQPVLRAEVTRLLTHAHYQHRHLRKRDLLADRLRTPVWVRLVAYLEGWLAGRG